MLSPEEVRRFLDAIRSLSTTVRYLHVATSTICAAASPLDHLDLVRPLAWTASWPASSWR